MAALLHCLICSLFFTGTTLLSAISSILTNNIDSVKDKIVTNNIHAEDIDPSLKMWADSKYKSIAGIYFNVGLQGGIIHPDSKSIASCFDSCSLNKCTGFDFDADNSLCLHYNSLLEECQEMTDQRGVTHIRLEICTAGN